MKVKFIFFHNEKLFTVAVVRTHRMTCYTCQFQSNSKTWHHKHGTLSLLTLDPALPYRHLNAILKPTFSLILNWRHKRLCIPRRTLWRYTNVVLLLLLTWPKPYEEWAKWNANIHCVSKKTTMTFYAITSMHINRF